MSQESSASRPVLEAKNVSVVYGKNKVLDIPHLEIAPNRVTTIIGPNGSGKTTLLLCLALLLKPTTGQILYQGQPLTNSSSFLPLRRRFAVVFQESLLLNGTVWNNVTMGMQLRGFKHQEINKRAQYWLDRFGIAALAQRSTGTLSGGEAQRTSLARAFVLQPEVLFLDEPFAALDVPTHQSLFGDMMNILQETNFTTVMVTHDRNEAQTLSDRVAVIMQGQLVQFGIPREIFMAPASEDIAKFIGMENILEGRVIINTGGLADVNVAGQTIEGVSCSHCGSLVKVFIRPEDIILSLSQPASSARNVFAGRIQTLIPTGPLVRVSLDCGFPLISLITQISAEEMHLEKGQTIYASFKATAIHIMERRDTGKSPDA